MNALVEELDSLRIQQSIVYRGQPNSVRVFDGGSPSLEQHIFRSNWERNQVPGAIQEYTSQRRFNHNVLCHKSVAHQLGFLHRREQLFRRLPYPEEGA